MLEFQYLGCRLNRTNYLLKQVSTDAIDTRFIQLSDRKALIHKTGVYHSNT